MKIKTQNIIFATIIFFGLFVFTYSISAAVTKTLYSWAKDAAGNVSISLSDYVDITLPEGPSNTYYVSYSEGSDTNNGTSPSTPWKTIAKVNASTFLPGDSILFKRGETWSIGPGGYLHTDYDGTSENPITFGAYGSGEDPIFTSFETITGWTNEGGGIYSKNVSIESNQDVETFVVTVDGVNTAMGRYPETGWLTYESVGTLETSITDNELPESPNWTGAEAVIRKSSNAWMLDRNIITNQNNHKLTYTAGSNWQPSAGFGYFIQRDIKTLTYFGAWYYDRDDSKFYMYFGSENTNNHTIKVATAKYPIESYYNSYHTFDHLSFIGFNNWGHFNRGSDHIIIQNSKAQFIGLNGFFVWPYDGGASYLTYDNNTISDSGGGIQIKGIGTNMLIKNNNISDIGLVMGGCALNTDDNWGDGIYIHSPDSIIENNIITTVGHSGIRFHGGDNIIVRNNYVNGFGFTRYDAGGIYTWNDGQYDPDYQKIQNNIVVNSNSISSGIGGSNNLALWGIYLDLYDTDTNIEVTGNTVANSSTAGFLIYLSQNVIAHDNTFYNNGYQIQLSDMHGTNYITGCNIFDNIFFAKENNQLVLQFSSLVNNFNSFGIANNNYYVRPISDDYIFNTELNYGQTTQNYTLSGWKTLSGQDSNSHSSPASITSTNDILFDYNATTSNKVVSLGSNTYIDVKGTVYSGSVTLLPYTSIVLIKPDSLNLSNNGIAENNAIGATIGNLSTFPSGSNTYTYTLVSGTGSTDNASFSINESSLNTDVVFDYETKNSYTIRVRSTDQTNAYIEKVFTITIADVYELNDLIIDGGFNDPTKWPVSGGPWVVTGGVLSKSEYGEARVNPAIQPLDYGTTYNISYDVVNYQEGGVSIYFDFGTSGAVRTANGHYTEQLTTLPYQYGWENIFTIFGAWGFKGEVDNLTIIPSGVLGVSTYNFTKDLKLGSRGNEVIELQKILISKGHLKISIPTGTFGSLTEKSLKDYQKANNLTSDGIVGEKTREVLNR